MNKVRLIAACAALSLVVAACGDDDDDASGDTTADTIVPAAGADATVADDAAGTDECHRPLPTRRRRRRRPSPEVVADCQAIFNAAPTIADDVPDDPAVGDEIPDEYKDAVQELVDAIEDADLETDEVQSAADALVDSGNEVIDADTWTEELQTETQDAFTPLGSLRRRSPRRRTAADPIPPAPVIGPSLASTPCPRFGRPDHRGDANDPLIVAHDLVKRFGDLTAVDGIDVDVRRGEAFGFLGPNGAGKSSTMRMIGCTSPVTSGTLRVLGLDPATHGRDDPRPPRRGAAAGPARR